MTNINTLFKKYYNPDGENMTGTEKRNKHEQTTNEYDKTQKRETSQRKRQALLTQILNEAPFRLTKTQTKQIRYWINQFNNEFQYFHRQSKDETILTAMIMIQRKKTKTNIDIENHPLCIKYDLDNQKFMLIQNRLIFKLMKSTPLMYNQKILLDNNLE